MIMTQEMRSTMCTCQLSHRNTSLVSLHCAIIRPRSSSPTRSNPSAKLYVLPGWIQDESSKEMTQEMHALYKFTIPAEQLFAEGNDAVLEPKLEFQRDCWNTSKLTPARRVQLSWQTLCSEYIIRLRGWGKSSWQRIIPS